MTDLYEKNERELNELLDRKERLEKHDLSRYRYYTDELGNIYAWHTHRQEDGKFHAYITNRRSGKTKRRTFSKRKSAKDWVRRNAMKNRVLQKERSIEQMKRKEILKSQQPVKTPEQKKKEVLDKRMSDLKNRLAIKQRKIKLLSTLIKKDERKIKHLYRVYSRV